MRQAIITKFLSPTDFKGSRVKATAAEGSITLAWNHEHSPEWNHEFAAMALMNKFGWDRDNAPLGGSLPDSSGYAFVMVKL